MKPIFFKSQQELRKWFLKNHSKTNELWVGFYKKNSKQKGVTYKESVDQALCFGWIDGIAKGIDENKYMQRFTPRRPKSIWSFINTKRIAELTKLGIMHERGLKTFRERDKKRTGMYSSEQAKPLRLDNASIKKFKSNPKAWKYWKACPPGYKSTVAWWVISAKKEETKASRLATVIKDSQHQKRIALLTSPKKRK
jgi:uncharacterized protein YdeI (YjbR/CyaY-like superfamily)